MLAVEGQILGLPFWLPISAEEESASCDEVWRFSDDEVEKIRLARRRIPCEPKLLRVDCIQLCNKGVDRMYARMDDGKTIIKPAGINPAKNKY